MTLVLTGPVAAAQLVPEGIHQDAEGPVTMCGITAANAAGYVEQLRASAGFRRTTETESGSLTHRRNLHCEASRVACDRLFLEFQTLDDALQQALEPGSVPR